MVSGLFPEEAHISVVVVVVTRSVWEPGAFVDGLSNKCSARLSLEFQNERATDSHVSCKPENQNKSSFLCRHACGLSGGS